VPGGPRILVVHHAAAGHTARVAAHVADRCAAGGADVARHDTTDAPPPTGFDAVAAGDAIHMGRHSGELTGWLRSHAPALMACPLGLFQVSLTSAVDDAEHTREAGGLARALVDEVGIDPDLVGLFGGELAYTRYGWLKRRMVRSIAAQDGLPTDTGRDHDLTDWDAVDRFADDLLALATAAARARHRRAADGDPGQAAASA
jgi:menaquinone-dependent protoporphyrinogen oxidase